MSLPLYSVTQGSNIGAPNCALSKYMYRTNIIRLVVQEMNVMAGPKEARDYLHTLHDNGVQMRTPASEKPDQQSPTPTAGGSPGTSASGMIIG